ncbi:MAG: hypothetical protein O9302_09315 [Cyclobacteriaceae bacterium]|nr:hypothetical protein [Cytophagales bacterium]MCZ8328243.1 hypothetical protein [Cyclobacteriaceae bacterium]
MENSKIDYTADGKFSSVYNLFDSYSKLFRKKTRASYMGVFRSFVNFAQSHSPELRYNCSNEFELQAHLNEHISIQFKEYLLKSKLKDHSCNTKLSIFNKILKYAVNSGVVNNKIFLYAVIAYSEGEVGRITPYSEFEFKKINEMLLAELSDINRLLKNTPIYNRKNVGVCPIEDKAKFGKKAVGFRSKENCIYYFENTLNSSPISFSGDHKKFHISFLKAIAYKHGGIEAFYKDLGVAQLIDSKIVGVLLLKLASITGLNPCSIFSLKVDCLTDKNQLTGSPIIQYEKRRSNGAGTLYLEQKDDNVAILDIKKKEYAAIKKIVSDVIKLTSTFRMKANPNEKDLLFIYESSGRNTYSKVRSFDDRKLFSVTSYLKKKHQLSDEKGNPIKLNLVRFRTTYLNNLFIEGRDISEIQVKAGHSSILETIKYLHKHKLEPKLIEEDGKVLTGIYKSRVDVELKNNNHNLDNDVYEGIYCNCKNIYDPPEEVKKLKVYKEGQPCTWFNMCFFCKNLIISNLHLPKIFAYYFQITNSQAFLKSELPNNHLYIRIVNIIESIMDPSKSGFDKEVIDNALMKAKELYCDQIDSNVYVPSKF